MDSPNANAPLVEFLRDHPKNDSSFPLKDTDYHDRFRHLDNYLNKKIHPFINQGAAAHDDGWLTDHGVQHITTVIQRTSDLAIKDGKTVLTPYEAFLLLVAIHFHDIGNVFGREGHERRITDAMQDQDVSKLMGADGIEKRMIRDIAMAHGGYVDVEKQDKDTIGGLPWQHHVGSSDPRIQLVAALLRFADELADDHTRTSRFLQNNELLKGSEVYHIYADRLRQVIIRPDERRIRLQFEFNADHAKRKYRKGPKERVYLYDEIVQRCLKMHRENVYCSRFMQPYISINRIDVDIDVTTNDYMKVLKKINFPLVQRGYPDSPVTLVDAAPDAESLTGSKLCCYIKQVCS